VPTGLQGGDAGLHREHRALEVDVHDGVDVLLGHVDQRLVRKDSCVRAEDVYGAEPVQSDLGDHSALIHAGHVCDDRLDATRCDRGQRSGRRIERGRVATRDQHVCALLGEHPGDALADALAAAGDDDRAALH
jgi:hypothetical protein